MDELRIHPPPAIGTEDLDWLLAAARAALRLLSDLDEHLPCDAPRLGSEGRIRRQLREAIRLASFEVRDCDDCDGGGMILDPDERPEPVPCASCDGVGERRVYSYGRPKRRK